MAASIDFYDALGGPSAGCNGVVLGRSRPIIASRIKSVLESSATVKSRHSRARNSLMGGVLNSVCEAVVRLFHGCGHRLRLGFESSFPVARHLNAQWPIVGQHRLAAPAIAMIGRRLRLVGSGGVAQVVTHLRTQGAFDQRLLERPRGVIDRRRRHRPLDQMVKQFRWNLGQHRRLRSSVGLLHLPYWLRHTCSFQMTWYASHTKFLTGPATAMPTLLPGTTT